MVLSLGKVSSGAVAFSPNRKASNPGKEAPVLPLSLQVYHRKIDDGPQASVALQHLQFIGNGRSQLTKAFGDGRIIISKPWPPPLPAHHPSSRQVLHRGWYNLKDCLIRSTAERLASRSLYD